MRVAVFGASAMVGQGVLDACLQDPRVDDILVVARTPLNPRHPRRRFGWRAGPWALETGSGRVEELGGPRPDLAVIKAGRPGGPPPTGVEDEPPGRVRPGQRRVLGM